jgi:hypothetical protein
VNFALLASCFLACAAAVSKVNRELLESGSTLRGAWAGVSPIGLLEAEENVWPAPEL